ncbi:MAG: exonuclease [Desulfobulbaceae bacterium]|nr:MAG: exonuclease [Desulfobulbaceae bacterium]
MLYSTFCHIPGIGYSTEKKLWNEGIDSWQRLLECRDRISRVSPHEIENVLHLSAEALAADNPTYFTQNLKTRDSWRLFPHFRHVTCFLDIETSGLREDAEITTIALYDGEQVRTYINGENLEDFLNDVDQFKVMVTYNGISFDVPFIERHFRTRLTQAQLDLRFILAQLGFRGGLKGCEKLAGINRGTLDGIDGAFAVLLWREFERYNDRRALETLLAYNIEDTVNLERLLVEAYNRNIRLLEREPSLELDYPNPPPLLYVPDLETVRKIKQANY